MSDPIEVITTPPDLIQRMQRYPQQLDATMNKTAAAAIVTVLENVPSYPRRPNSSYRRTGTLGRSLGVGQGGAPIGSPDIMQVKRLGTGQYEGTFGSRLSYAPDVIGDPGQKPIHKGIWWTIADVAKRATPKVIKLYEQVSEQMVKFLEGRL